MRTFRSLKHPKTTYRASVHLTTEKCRAYVPPNVDCILPWPFFFQAIYWWYWVYTLSHMWIHSSFSTKTAIYGACPWIKSWKCCYSEKHNFFQKEIKETYHVLSFYTHNWSKSFLRNLRNRTVHKNLRINP